MVENLYHFTTIESLISMLSDCSEKNPYITFWATHIRFLNDSSEYKYGLQLCMKYLQKYQEDFLPEGTGISLTPTERSIDTKSDSYVVSFAKVCDIAAMWAMYAKHGTGIALVFNKAKLKDIEDASKLTLSPCIYLTNEDELLTYRESLKKTYKVNYGKWEDDEMFVSREALRVTLSMHSTMRPFFSIIKNPSFEYENEERFICEDNKPPKYRFSNGHLCPYKEIRIPINALEGIVLGPTLTSDLDMAALQSYLVDKGLNELSKNISVSKVPYR